MEGCHRRERSHSCGFLIRAQDTERSLIPSFKTRMFSVLRAQIGAHGGGDGGVGLFSLLHFLSPTPTLIRHLGGPVY